MTTRCIFKSLFDIMIKISRLGRGEVGVGAGEGGFDNVWNGEGTDNTTEYSTDQL